MAGVSGMAEKSVKGFGFAKKEVETVSFSRNDTSRPVETRLCGCFLSNFETILLDNFK